MLKVDGIFAFEGRTAQSAQMGTVKDLFLTALTTRTSMHYIVFHLGALLRKKQKTPLADCLLCSRYLFLRTAIGVSKCYVLID